ncbi:endolytic transglycosylase MltG [Winogradskyella aquimaris]|uniref:Endolytic murein transglycosylase n=1 Tax=Winogradskyella aquimaris TaxID=864074 RepID=A0ABU5ESM7_9FLAO|nr:endolytic transglycosylase MltG [Winogradskyella aquimaris]MDY2587687.1 endolytic transglycosylase MltG [Winogradskyella aquimaris]
MYIKKILWGVSLLGLVIFGAIAYYIYSAVFQPNTKFETETAYIYVPTGANYLQVRQQLDTLLKDMTAFDALARQKKYTSNITAGRFAISKGMNNNEIINSIRSRNLPLKIAFNNQHSLEDLAGRISSQIEADSLSLIKAMTDKTFLDENGFTEATALGMYLPNSYEFYWNTSAEGFRDKMLTEYKRFWNEIRLEKAKQLNLSPDEVMTLASIVHEESKQADEQPRVAGVYLNRLRLGMPLQADPTLKFAAYQLPEYQNTVIRRILNIHKEIDSPYNTYKNAGLPPGLIAMPDLSAVKAVLNPEKHSYLYFAADAKRLGYHKFAKTLAQHNINAREYQRYLSSQGINR